MNKPDETYPVSPRPIVWSIAGSDSGGGAGIQADLLTCHQLGVHGCSVITAITAQNSTQVIGVDAVLMQTFVSQLDALEADLPADGIKIGLLPTRLHLEVLAKRLAHWRTSKVDSTSPQNVASSKSPFVVYDPVAIASVGQAMASPDVLQGVDALFAQLDLLTPNQPELECLTGIAISSPQQLVVAAQQLRHRGVKAVLVKGGHASWQGDWCLDYFCDEQQSFWLALPRLDTRHGHGTGCCYASAIAALVAQGYGLVDAITLARAYVQQGLAAARGIGQGPGPIAHLGWPVARQHFPQLVLPGSALSRAYGLCGSSQPGSAGAGASIARLPTESFASCPRHLGLYPVVDSAAWVEKLLAWGVRTVQLRIKDPQHPRLEQEIREAIALGQKYQARVFINDYWQLAIRHGAYGVHLGQEDLLQADLAAIQRAGLRLGLSTHGYHEIACALALAPSYIALGHIFPTTTKQMPSAPQGLLRLSRYAELLSDVATVAIGGISQARVAAVLATGVGSVALVTAITEAADPHGVTLALLAQVGAGDTLLPDAAVSDAVVSYVAATPTARPSAAQDSSHPQSRQSEHPHCPVEACHD
jgi:hydroxymethylpyrimidine kinase/phosphomethylpyrimidine kinase/thiamine-phosphate diphosphorylase